MIVALQKLSLAVNTRAVHEPLCTEGFISCVNKGLGASHKLCETWTEHPKSCVNLGASIFDKVNIITLASLFSSPIKSPWYIKSSINIPELLLPPQSAAYSHNRQCPYERSSPLYSSSRQIPSGMTSPALTADMPSSHRQCSIFLWYNWNVFLHLVPNFEDMP